MVPACIPTLLKEFYTLIDQMKLSPTSIQLFDQNGRKMDTKFEDNHLDISHFPSGIYFLHSMHPTMGNKVEKIVKM
ncbi:MAG: T9SS type A sorting domain-containing protein [Saprospiraceae bacterium]|nr:T9SS type A sorting domain-containing protein [Saprospiraceae bacterium]